MATKTKPVLATVRAAKPKALDLGILQSNLEDAAKALKATTSALLRASEANIRAEADYDTAKKALNAGVSQIAASTKV